MFSLSTLIVLIPVLPLMGAVVTAVLGPRWLRQQSHWPTILGVVGSFACTILLTAQVRQDFISANVQTDREHIVTLWTWVDLPGESSGLLAADPPLRVDVALRSDALTAIMLLMVTLISSLIVVYSAGYMHGDRGYWRFFTYLGLFVFSMTMLVSASNFLLLFVFWEAVGVCSYLLIGFWYEKPAAAAAGMKAFLVNRVGDFGFALALLLIFVTYGTWNFHDLPGGIPGVLGATRLSGGAGGYVAGGMGLAICLLLLLGACGKSAQFPLHIWLADAMEGPTPVSALIHAATMVTAGVYMVTRCTPLFFASPAAQLTVACVGGVTACMAGLIALTQFDLKRVLAYSTISQLGYMFLGLGVGTFAGIAAGMFHLFTHAFFKALLFLGAGSVMHAMGSVIDMRKFGGLRRVMPITHWTFLVGCLALAGVLPLSGFWSKDAILGAVHDQAAAMSDELSKRPELPIGTPGSNRQVPDTVRLTAIDAEMEHDSENDNHAPTTAHLSHLSPEMLRTGARVYSVLYWMAIASAFLTAVYTFRMFFMTFYGETEIPYEAGDHAQESPASMWVPLCILAAFAFAVGGLLHATHLFYRFLAFTPSLTTAAVRLTPQPGVFHLDIAVLSSIVAILGVACAAFLYLGRQAEAATLMRWFSTPWLGAPYVLARGKFFWDEIYALVLVRPLKLLASALDWLDQNLVDGVVNLVGWLPRAVGASARGLQMGFVPFYALAMAMGILTLIASRMLWGG